MDERRLRALYLYLVLTPIKNVSMAFVRENLAVGLGLPTVDLEMLIGDDEITTLINKHWNPNHG